MGDAKSIRGAIAKAAPRLTGQIGSLLEKWVPPIVDNLDRLRPGRVPKIINDPIWGVIELYPWETAILDSPMLQRLRGIRQLGLAHLVYPGANHSRFEHTLGVLEATSRIIRALERQQEHLDRSGEPFQTVQPDDRTAYRLAALLHDVGHGPYSHLTEPVLAAEFAEEIHAATSVIREEQYFPDTKNIQPAELLSVMIVLHGSMEPVLMHSNLEHKRGELPLRIAGGILGSASFLEAKYLSGVISGPLDADKLDYMARDSYHTGLNLGLETDRLISKLAVVVLTPDNAPNVDLKQRVQNSPGQRLYELGIAQAGLGAYEQILIGRVILYDRLYHHHKVRAAECMAARVFALASKHRRFDLGEFLSLPSDDAAIKTVADRGADSPDARSMTLLADSLVNRQIFHRAFAFGSRFVSEHGNNEGRAVLAVRWDRVMKPLQQVPEEFRDVVFETAKAIVALDIAELRDAGNDLIPEEIIVDLPQDKSVARGNDLLIRSEAGRVSLPTLFFNPEQWGAAYQKQKHKGFVYTPRRRIPLIALAARIAFYQRFDLPLDLYSCDLAAKTSGIVKLDWLERCRDSGIIDERVYSLLAGVSIRRLTVHSPDFGSGPHDISSTIWAELVARLASEIAAAAPDGLPVNEIGCLTLGVSTLTRFAQLSITGGSFQAESELRESALQNKFVEYCRAAAIETAEGQSLGGGETDVVLQGGTLVELKVLGPCEDPFEKAREHQWQSRRYALALNKHLSFLLVGYKPKEEASLLPVGLCTKIGRIQASPEGHVTVIVVVPYGYPVPSRAGRSRESAA